MNYKTTLILALVFVVGVAGVLMLNKSDEKREEQKKIEGKLLNVEKEDITEIYIEPNKVRAVKQGDSWKITEPVETDGEKTSIESICGMFNWANIERAVSSDPADYATFGLQPPKGKMVITHKDGVDTLYLGDRSPTGSYVFARRGGAPDVFLTTTSLETYTNKTLFDLREKKVLSFDKNQVRTFELLNKSDKLLFEKDGTEWNMVDPLKLRGDRTELDKIVNRLNTERAKEFVDEAPEDLSKYGLHNPIVKATFTLGEDKATKRLIIGSKKDDRYYAKDESRRPVFLVDTSFVSLLQADRNKLRNKRLADFVTTDIDLMEITFSDTTFICEKDTASNWFIKEPIEAKAKNWKISPITSAAANLQVKEFVTDSPGSLARYGLDRPQIVASFFKEGKELMKVLVGKKAGDNNVYLKTGDNPSVYKVGDDIIKKLKVDLEDVREAPQTAAADSTN